MSELADFSPPGAGGTGGPARPAKVLRAGLCTVQAAVLLGVLTALAGCVAVTSKPDTDDPLKRLQPPAFTQQSLVYGFLDMDEAPTGLGWVEFHQLEPPTDRAYYQMRVHEGVFYMEKFRPGIFVLGGFGGTRWNGEELAYTLPRTSPAVRVTIQEPGLHFVGAYRYRAVQENGQRTGRFEIDRISTPDEAAVLRTILPFAAGTPWEARIRQRMSEAR